MQNRLSSHLRAALARWRCGAVEVLLIHPGGPFWRRRDAGAWSIPKGEYSAGEDPLETAIREHDVRAVFVGLTVNSSLAQRVAEDTGVQLVFLYTGSLSEPGGPAGDYLTMMRYNVSAMVAALR